MSLVSNTLGQLNLLFNSLYVTDKYCKKYSQKPLTMKAQQSAVQVSEEGNPTSNLKLFFVVLSNPPCYSMLCTLSQKNA
jgi:hypothetical protein